MLVHFSPRLQCSDADFDFLSLFLSFISFVFPSGHTNTFILIFKHVLYSTRAIWIHFDP